VRALGGVSTDCLTAAAKGHHMGYRDDFYTLRNIIGYTGDLNYLPTVYFQRGQEFGHITQYHNRGYNVGREEVESHPCYRIINVKRDGHIHSTEWKGSHNFHTSRTRFIARALLKPFDLTTLSVAIFRFREMKLMYSASQQVANKHWLNQEILTHGVRNDPHGLLRSVHQQAAFDRQMRELDRQNPGLNQRLAVGAQLARQRRGL
jgi:hypothetical protein